MSKRITLTDFELQQIIAGVKKLRDETYISYEVVNVGKRFYNQLLCKLESPKKAADKELPDRDKNNDH